MQVGACAPGPIAPWSDYALSPPADPTGAVRHGRLGLRRIRPGTADPGAVHAGPAVRMGI